MAEYIKREDALSAAIRWLRKPVFITDAIKAIPSEDVRENVRGEWKQVWFHTESDAEDEGWWILRCSNCMTTNVKASRFCPNCGADMRGEQND